MAKIIWFFFKICLQTLYLTDLGLVSSFLLDSSISSLCLEYLSTVFSIDSCLLGILFLYLSRQIGFIDWSAIDPLLGGFLSFFIMLAIGVIPSLIHGNVKKRKYAQEIKQILIEKLEKFLTEHQKKREKAKGMVDKFLD